MAWISRSKQNGLVLLSPHPTQAGCWCSCSAQRPNVSLIWCPTRTRSCNGLRACLSELTCGSLCWHWVEQSVDAGQDGCERDASSGNVQAASPVPQPPTPMHKPAEATLHDPAARKHDEACLSRVALDHTVAHAVPVRPLRAARCREGPIHDRLPQAGP